MKNILGKTAILFLLIFFNNILVAAKPDLAAKAEPTIAEWTIVILIQASNNLDSFAHKNMREMMKWGSTKKVNILVDLHKAGDKSWRYKIEQGCCVVEKVEMRRAEGSIADEVLSTAEWAITNHPANHYAFIFWNHGYGCIDPQISGSTPAYLKTLEQGWRAPLSQKNDKTEQLTRAWRNSIPIDRSILFDDERHIYLSNQGLRETLKTISTRFLKGKKIDLIGMDACLMGMIEIAAEIEPYAEYFVASEEFEFAHGWPYGALIEKLTTQAVTSKELGTHIVQAYEAYYLNRTSYFTQSCVDLSKINALKENVTLLAELLLAAQKEDPIRMKLFIQQARCQTLSFSLSDYVDFHSFYQELLKVTQYAVNNPQNKTISIPRINPTILKTIEKILIQGMTLLKEAVVANTAGRYLARASGLSLYFPQKNLDKSYALTTFAQTVPHWPNFVQQHILDR